MKHEMISRIESLLASPKADHKITMLVDVKARNAPELFEYVTYESHTDAAVLAVDKHGQQYEIVNMARIKKAVQTLNFNEKIGKVVDSKSPKTQDRYLGIELEFVSKLSDPEMRLLMIEAGVEDHVTVKDDGSIETTDAFPFSHEICVLVKESELSDVMKRICGALAGNSKANKSCGMHVHVDMRDRNVKRAYKNLFEAQPVLYAMCPKSRRDGGYSNPTTAYEAFEERSANEARRYSGINKTAFGIHKTLEVRIHSGTLQASKIIYWAKLLVKIADKRATKYSSAKLETNFEKFATKLKLEPDLKAYVSARIEEFKTAHNGTNIPLAA